MQVMHCPFAPKLWKSVRTRYLTAYSWCFNSFLPVACPEPRNPCLPSPCGVNSICRVQDDRPVCSCKIGYMGAPPNCRPECLVHSECPLDRACFHQKCTDPCVGTCGYGARCKVVNHNPICSCPSGFIGDPFSRCFKEGKHGICRLYVYLACMPLLF